ncbi:unnamed protein product [Thlaspi arvense]|uniref:SHSP domain-containing protein n=1 Tax=Thlaspi arvense TaxID=13288 RepID=A0AAU9T3V7_THLAR|nr:unnamed protein product [Thlaspi arvense]
MSIMNILPVPQSHDGSFYATNNPYQLNGPRGFSEFRMMEENEDLFVRLDFPGITKESIKILVEPLKKAVFVFGDAPKELNHDSSHRKYGTATGLVCDCCELSNIQCFVGDGVVRLILSKKKINLHVPSSCYFGGAIVPITPPHFAHIIYGYNPQVYLTFFLVCVDSPVAAAGGHPLAHLRGQNLEGRRATDPLDPTLTGRVIQPHPSVLEGPTSAYEFKQLQNGGLFLRIDMPGVPHDNFTVSIEGDGTVTVIGRAPPVLFDSSGREYGGKVAILPRNYDSRRIKTIAKHGVIRLIIPAY